MKLILLLFICILVVSCNQPPKKKLSQFKMKIEYDVKNDTLGIVMNNPLHCPIQIKAKSTNDTIQSLLSTNFPIVLSPKADTLLSFATSLSKEEVPIRFSATLGDPNLTVNPDSIELPFPQNKQYKIIQGYNGKFSHTSDYSRYAIDFNLSIGDTICAAADGFVVGVIEGYMHGGTSKKWSNYANFITLYHPSMNMYTQYVHLVHNGSFVAVGDTIKSGQVIGLAGMTGFTDIEHLHFNVLSSHENGMESIPINFREGYNGKELTKGKKIRKTTHE